MGCASAKPKRTTSIEDIPGKQPHDAKQVPDKNGQVNKTPGGEKTQEKILREKDASKQYSETNAIEIPGAHKSFMAPDGIPFIDEDIESEVDDGVPAGIQLTAVNDNRVKLTSPDQNKNVAIVANKEVKLSSNADAAIVATRSSALREEAPGDTNRAVGGGKPEESRKEPSTSEPVVITDIKLQEVQITTTNNQQTDSTEVRSRTVVTDNKPKTDEELAATKIQAGIRGYLDRQKVKAIKANKRHSSETEEQHLDAELQQSGPKVEEHVVEEHVEWNSDDPHDPKLDEAATKIQARYKGYRTRKEIKIHPE